MPLNRKLKIEIDKDYFVTDTGYQAFIVKAKKVDGDFFVGTILKGVCHRPGECDSVEGEDVWLYTKRQGRRISVA